MTCIVAVEAHGSVWMGGDSLATDDQLDMVTLAESKVFERGGMMFASGGSPRSGQILRYRLVIPAHPEGMPDEEYLCTVFVDALRAAFRDAGSMTSKDGADEASGFLLGYRGKVYDIESGFAVIRSARGFSALGTGAKYALGAIVTLDGADAPTIIRAALRAAEKCNAGVRRPFTLLHGAAMGAR